MHEWDDWNGRMGDEQLPVAAALWVLRDGTVDDRRLLAMADNLPADIALSLATDEDQDVLDFLVSNYSVHADILELLALSGRVDTERVAGNPNAPLHRKLAAPIHIHSPSSLRRFLDAVRANDEERYAVHAAQESRRHRLDTLGAVWARVRPGTVGN